MSRKTERGEGRLKALIWFAVLITIGYILFKVVPPYLNNYQLKDTLVTEARFYSAHQKNEEQAREAVWKEIQNLQIPAKREDIKVSTTGRTSRISVSYTVVVDLPGYQWQIDFNPQAESPVF